MERKAATPRGISEVLETLQERSFGRRKRSGRSESDEAAQNSPPGKRVPVVEYAITLNFYCRLYRLITRMVDHMKEVDVSYDWVDIASLIGGAFFITSLLYGLIQL